MSKERRTGPEFVIEEAGMDAHTSRFAGKPERPRTHYEFRFVLSRWPPYYLPLHRSHSRYKEKRCFLMDNTGANRWRRRCLRVSGPDWYYRLPSDATFVVDKDKRCSHGTGYRTDDRHSKKTSSGGKLWYALHFTKTPSYPIDSIFSGTIRSIPGIRMSERGDTITAEVFVTSMRGGRGAYIWAMASALYDDWGTLSERSNQSWYHGSQKIERASAERSKIPYPPWTYTGPCTGTQGWKNPLYKPCNIQT